MPRGENLDHKHQVRSATKPRPSKLGARGMKKSRVLAEAPPPDPTEDLEIKDGVMTIDQETLDAATLRLQIARANAQEEDAAKKRIELDALRGKMMTKEQAVDLAQAAVLAVVAILDLLPERIRMRIDAGATMARDEFCAILDDEIREARQKVADG